MTDLVAYLLDKKEHLAFLGVFLIFALLIFKDPFSERTLIPNFEPYPDTFNYINPALNTVKGKGFNMNREGRVINSNVPPLYSFSLIPSLIFRPDPRMTYYANVVIAFASLFLFWLILKKLFINKLVIYSLSVLYITDYFIYWVPSLVMAENLTLTLYLAVIFFLLSKTTKINLVLIAFLAVAVYATKYANIPITLSIIFLYFTRVIFSELSGRQKVYNILSFAGAIMVFLLVLAGFEEVTKGNNIFTQICSYISIINRSVPKIDSGSKDVASASWFGIQYVSKNIPLYINSLLGQPNKFLWDNTPLVPNLVGILGLAGIIWNIFNRKFFFVSSMLFIFVVSSVGFMSTFYSFDARYIYIAIPSLLIGLGLFLTALENKLLNRKKFINALVFLFLCTYLLSSFTRIKSQISLNLRYAETPWNYIAILKMNEYLTFDKIKGGKKPVLISALPPFLVDYFANSNYALLPLSYDQEFRSMKALVWGSNNYSDLPKLYKKYLNEGYNVYVSRAGLGNEGYTNRDFNAIVKEFDTQLVQPGCYDQCNIYSVKLKEKK